MTAKLTAYAPEKAQRFTKLEKVLISESAEAAKPRPERQTWQQQMAILERW